MKDDTENNIKDFEDWVSENMMDSPTSPSPPDENQETVDEDEAETPLKRIRGDSSRETLIKQNRYTSTIFKTLIIIFVTIITVLFFIRAHFNPVTVVGPSMEPTLHDGDILRTSTDFKPKDLTYDEIICFEVNKKTLIKRVVGMPGDSISFKNGYIYINGKKRIDEFPKMKEFPQDKITLGEDEYYCLGDNRNMSSDSRVYGPIKFSQITHLVIYNSTQQSKDLKEMINFYEKYQDATLTDASLTDASLTDASLTDAIKTLLNEEETEE